MDVKTIFIAVASPILKLGEDLGFEIVDAGALSIARLLDPVAALWMRLAFRRGLGRNFAFKLLQR